MLYEIKSKQEQDHYSQLKLNELQKRKEKIIKHIDMIKKESKVGICKENKLIYINYINQQHVDNLLRNVVDNVNNETHIL